MIRLIPNHGYWVVGSDSYDQIVMSTEGKIKINYQWINCYLPGIY